VAAGVGPPPPRGDRELGLAARANPIVARASTCPLRAHPHHPTLPGRPMLELDTRTSTGTGTALLIGAPDRPDPPGRAAHRASSDP